MRKDWPVNRHTRQILPSAIITLSTNDAPGPALLLHLALQVAAGHVQTDAVAEDVFLRIRRFDIPPACADRHHQLDFMVQVAGERGVVHLAGLAGSDHDVSDARGLASRSRS